MDSGADATWVTGAEGSGRGRAHLPYAVARPRGGDWRVVVGIADHALDLAALARDGLLDGTVGDPQGVLAAPTLAPLVRCRRTEWDALRERVSSLLAPADTELAGTALAERALLAGAELELRLPLRPGDVVDFYASEAHATHVGELFRPGGDPLLPNWRHLPVGYHARSGTVQPSGDPVVRPRGQRPPPMEGSPPTFGPTERLDYELELGVLVGGADPADPDARVNPPGTAVPIEQAENHLFGVVLVNDWSARDLQAWEYRPLGPFLGKSFATTMAAWVTPWQALAPLRCPPPPQDPPPLPHLRPSGPAALDLVLGVEVRPAGRGDFHRTGQAAFSAMYWTFPQMLAHVTSSGTSVRTGDLFASGTVSGWDAGTAGCLLEATRNGQKALDVGGVARRWLEDGDTVRLTGHGGRTDAPRLELAPAVGTVVPPA